MKIELHGVTKTQTVRRFIDLSRLFNLLLAGRVYFPSLGILQAADPFECSIPVRQRYQKMKRRELEDEAMSLLRSVPKRFLKGDQKFDYLVYRRLVRRCRVEQLRQHVREIDLTQLRSRVVCNCWHLSETESDAMWKLYGSGPGVMIVSTIGRLAGAIRGQYSSMSCSPNPQGYTICPVQYVDPEELGELSPFYAARPWLLKRKSFAHESEIRVSHTIPWIIFPCDDGISVQMDPGKLIKEIVLSPFNPPWMNEGIVRAIHAILKSQKLKIDLRLSAHMRSPGFSSVIVGQLEQLRLRESVGQRTVLRRRKRIYRIKSTPIAT